MVLDHEIDYQILHPPLGCMEMFDLSKNHKKMKSHREQKFILLNIWELHSQEMLGEFQRIQILMDSKKFDQDTQISLS